MDPSIELSPPQQALAALPPSDIAFLHTLPKAELHAHLNGCIPFPVLQALAHEHHARRLDSAANANDDDALSAVVKDGIDKLEGGAKLEKFQDFFALFPAIYYLTARPSTIAMVTDAVLSSFLDPTDPTDPHSANCQFLELRTTPRADRRTGLTRDAYLEAVLSVIDDRNLRAKETERGLALAEGRAARKDVGEARLIVSLDYRMDEDTIASILSLATDLRASGRPIVGLDVCGDPTEPPKDHMLSALRRAKADGWQLTIHVAELDIHAPEASLGLLAVGPRRVGHGTFLNEEGRRVVQEQGIVVEVCLTSNVLCMTTPTTADSHLHHYLGVGHPATICTDDTLPFATSLLAEYALLLAPAPLGLGMSRDEVATVARSGVDGRFDGW